MQEGDVEAFSSGARLLVDQLHAFRGGFVKSNLYIGRSKSDVVNAFAALLDKLGDGAIGARRLQKLNLSLTELEEGGLDLLIFHDLNVVALSAQYFFVVGQLFLDALHGDAEMFDVGNFHSDYPFIMNNVNVRTKVSGGLNFLSGLSQEQMKRAFLSLYPAFLSGKIWIRHAFPCSLWSFL
jgi:hypothetical protein